MEECGCWPGRPSTVVPMVQRLRRRMASGQQQASSGQQPLSGSKGGRWSSWLRTSEMALVSSGGMR
eukprot:644454-Lingulodinium_polyedra.AAC.1